MKKRTLLRLKAHFRRWSGGGWPESGDQITVYIDYALPTDIDAEPHEVREALWDWMESDDPDDDLYKPGEPRPNMMELTFGWKAGDWERRKNQPPV